MGETSKTGIKLEGFISPINKTVTMKTETVTITVNRKLHRDNLDAFTDSHGAYNNKHDQKRRPWSFGHNESHPKAVEIV
jgi:hypothetical protein